MPQKKKHPLIEGLEITDIADEGKSLGRFENMVVFVKGLVPGDIANVQVIRKRKKYLEGYATEIIKESYKRTTPFCSHYGTCGGCKWQILSYKEQLRFKQKQVNDHLQRIGKITLPDINPIIGSQNQQFYRNKLEFTFSSNRWLSEDEIKSGINFNDRRALGFHLPGKFDRVLDIDRCYLQHDLSNQIRNKIKEFTLRNHYEYYDHHNNSGLMRNLIIRNSTLDEWMIIIVFHHEEHEKIKRLMNYLHKEIPSITSLIYVINSKLNDSIHDLEFCVYSGRDHIFEEFDGLKFKIGPKSFFQTNTNQALRLYHVSLEFAQLTGNEIVYDLYTGAGTIANYIASKCKKVIGIESINAAVEDARSNSQINGIINTEFLAGDIKDVLKQDLIRKYGQPDTIITDPPRAGMHRNVVESIIETAPKRIIYISCNPATQARDIHLLRDYYCVTGVQPIDMFPHTHHVENIIRLDRI